MIGKKLFITLVVMTFPLTLGYITYKDNRQENALCKEAQNRYEVIHGILTIVAKNSEKPKVVKSYFDVLGKPPSKC